MSGNLYLITPSTTFIKKQVKDFKFYLEFENTWTLANGELSWKLLSYQSFHVAY